MLAPLLALALSAAPAAADGPLDLVKRADAEVKEILGGKEATVEKLAERAEVYIDFAELARRALGKEWDGLAAAQRKEFSDTMKGVLRASYAKKALSDGQGGSSVTYGAQTLKGDEAQVVTTLTVKQDAFPVVYKLYRAGAKAPWRIYDVITDEVSLVQTYNDQFRQVIAKKGFEGLLKSLKAKRAQLEKKDDAGTE